MAKHKISIVADENIPRLTQMFGDRAEITTVDGRSLSADQLIGVDVLMVRSVTQVNQPLLHASQIKFVGSATIGTDHIDKAYLKSQGIAFSSAPGCNADAVVEYDLCCLSHLLSVQGEKLQDKTVAIIGVGNVGQRLAKRLHSIGVVKVLLNDPPKAEQAPGFSSLTYCLAHADIVCMHTPLTKDGDWPTYHLIKAEQLALLKDNAILLNAGRGAAIKGDDLLTCLQQRSDIQVVLDVWEAEPFVDPKLARLVKIATPHIAGYSLEGKVRGTFMLKNALYNWLDLPSNNLLEDYLPPTDIVSVNVARTIKPLDLMNIVYDPYVDDRALRAALSLKNPQSAFDSLRKNYRIRREFSALQVTGELASIERMQLLNWGFSEGC